MERKPAPPVFDGAICRAARALLGLSQEQLCELAGCSRKLLNDYENGLSVPKDSKIADMRRALEVRGVVFVHLDDMVLVGARPGFAERRSPRGRALGRDNEATAED